jgi:fatty-acyl-CoA synthase
VSREKEIIRSDPKTSVVNRVRRAPGPREVLARWEAATALLLAYPPTADASLQFARMAPILLRWRDHPVGALVAAAARFPRRTAIIDGEGSLTFAELEQRSNALARVWQAQGIGPGSTIGLLCRDGRMFMDASIAAQKLGAGLVYLNAAFSAPQVAGVVIDEGIDVLVHNDALAPAVAEASSAQIITEDDLRRGVESETGRPLTPPARPGRIVVLTSGTTGRPKGAVRHGKTDPMAGTALLASLPVMSGDTTLIAAPLFHGFGLFGANLALALNSAIILRSRFDPRQALEDIAVHRAKVMVAVPVMLQRLVALPRRVTDGYNLESLRIVLCGGAALSASLAEEFMDRFGDVLYNVYGSTESGFATVATPGDLRRAPGTVGRPTPGVTIRIADAEGRRVPREVTGRVLVGSGLRMDGYTGGGGKEVIDGLVVTGDVGHLDRRGRVFIDGREDDMIVSGGENVFPAEVEETLVRHAGVAEAAVIGVPDDEFGQRLKAFIVREPGAQVTAAELSSFVHDHLARFKTPREVAFLEALPRTATGKVIRRELEAL